MTVWDASVLVILLGFVGHVLIVGRIVRKLEARIEALEVDSHPPVDVRTVARAYARTEVKRFLEEQVP